MGVVGLNEQRVVANIDLVFHTRLASLDQKRLSQWIVGRDQPNFAGIVVPRLQDNPALLRAQGNPAGKAFIRLEEDQRVGCRIAADPVQFDRPVPPVFIAQTVKHGGFIRAPDDVADGPFNLAVAPFARCASNGLV